MSNRIPRRNRLLFAGVLFLLGVGAAVYLRADIPVQIVIRVLFEQNGRPFDVPLKYTIECLGWNHGGDVTNIQKRPLEIVQSIAAQCPGYDCKIRHSLYNNPMKTHIAYCDMKVKLRDERTFTIEKYARAPVIDSQCRKNEQGGSEPAPLYECTLRFEVPKESAYAAD